MGGDAVVSAFGSRVGEEQVIRSGNARDFGCGGSCVFVDVQERPEEEVSLRPQFTQGARSERGNYQIVETVRS